MFSELVDEALQRSKRPDKQADIISYANQTIRELQSMKKGAFARDLVEDSVQVTATQTPITWTRPPNFRIMRVVRYRDTNNAFMPIYPKFIRPGQKQDSADHFYYAAGEYFAFGGVWYFSPDVNSSITMQIDLAYYVNAIRFKYYAVGSRKAVFDTEQETWSYPVDNTVDPVLQAQYQALVSNWLLLDYYDTVLEGTLAKLYKTINHPQAPSSFALFKSLEGDLIANEAFESLGMENSGA